MTKNIYCLLILIFCSISCKTDSEKKIEYLEKTEKINGLANRYLELNRFSGIILVTKNSNIIYNESFGLADYENQKTFSDKTTFKIGKISELITENIIREMVNKNKFQLSDSISMYIPEIKAKFTINDLLNHNTNLSGIQQIQQENPVLKYSTIEFTKLAMQSSDKIENSDLDYNILGLLIERISGTSFQKNVQNYCTNIGIYNTYFLKQDTLLAAGYLYNNYRGKDDELHKSPSADSNITFSSNGIKSNAHDLIKIINPNNKLDIYGYLENDGFSYSIQNYPEDKTTIIILSNRRHPVAKEISTGVYQILKDKDYRLPLLRQPFEIDKKLLKEYSGTYNMNQNMNFDILNENDSLFVILGPNKVHLIPQSSNQFYMKQTDASIRFLRDSTNNLVNEIVLLNGFLDGEKVKRIKK
ncbi:serine hydrolase domain-containing protein [Confluentibacter sediminis]|uniref:serine hydrolase domain-containing protein n=1 Tax=Confluentibacter sediminis TaxID=2219045 RepID=UPI000DACBB00|nr:serine hydrolase domain-containing protein [Confluentibacter sediminis]